MGGSTSKRRRHNKPVFVGSGRPSIKFVAGQAQLVSNEHAFRNAFMRFNGDRLNGWTPAKHALRGSVGTITRVFDDKTVTMIINGQQHDFPFEAIACQLTRADNQYFNGQAVQIQPDPALFGAAFNRFQGDSLNG